MEVHYSRQMIDLTKSKSKHTEEKLIFQEIHFLFDRYPKYNINGSTRENRVQNLANYYHFSLLVPLSPREKTFSLFPSNKKQLIDLVFEFVRKMMADTKFRIFLVMTGSSDTPVEVHDGLTIQQCDCHLFSKCLVFQMKNLVFQSKYRVFCSKTLDFDQNTSSFDSEFLKDYVFIH